MSSSRRLATNATHHLDDLMANDILNKLQDFFARINDVAKDEHLCRGGSGHISAATLHCTSQANAPSGRFPASRGSGEMTTLTLTSMRQHHC